jgi:hypothetical protein
MPSRSEVGHAKNVSNLETLISHCSSLGSAYNPSNESISLINLISFHDECKTAVATVKTTEATFNEIEGNRKEAFMPLKKLSTKVLAALKASGVPATVMKDASTINRKLQGRRAKNEPVYQLAEITKMDKISVSQQSYDMLIDHFDKLIALLEIEALYSPNEQLLTVQGLIDYKNELTIKNTAVKNSYTSYKNALIARNKKLYDQGGLITRVTLVKNYIKSIFGTSSPEYKTINSIRFKAD